MTQLEKLKHELDAIGVTYHETSRYGKYGVAKRVVIWKGVDGRVNEAEQVAHSSIMHVSTRDVMSAEEAIAVTLGGSREMMRVATQLDVSAGG